MFFVAGMKNAALHGGVGKVYFVIVEHFIRLHNGAALGATERSKEAFRIKGILLVGVGKVSVIGVPGDVVLVREKRTHTAHL